MVQSPARPEILFKLFDPNEDVTAVNALLRSAYQPLAAAGMKYAASHEGVEATLNNISNGECYVGILEGTVVASALLKIPAKNKSLGQGPSWYDRPGVTSFGKFAVSPDRQKLGFGSQLMDLLEARAKELGLEELALDTAETAEHLIKMYEARGYRFIQYHRWEITNYRSVVMSKKL